ncbi:MAG: hypothetical protein EHM51_02085, partial [Geobacter sp.]
MKRRSLLFLFLGLTCLLPAAYGEEPAAGRGAVAAPALSAGGAGSSPSWAPSAQGSAFAQGGSGMSGGAPSPQAPGQGNAGMPASSSGGEAGAKAEPGKGEAPAGKSPAAEIQAPGNGEVSQIEKFMSEDAAAGEKAQPQPFKMGRRAQCGYDFFRPEGAFAPLVDVPVGPDYIVGAGDRLVLTLWGSIDGTYELEINRAGEIVLPRVGAVKVAGQTYGELPGSLRSNLARVFKD